MVLNKLYVFAAAILLVSCTSNESIEQSVSSPEKKSGEALFMQHCAMCHGDDGRLGVGGAANLTEVKLTEDRIRQVLKNGKNAMPAMIGELGSRQAVDSVVAYTLELAKQ
jgi:cytochrome c6